jgi:hypothetical protein
MSPHSDDGPTVAYYDENAERFVAETASDLPEPVRAGIMALIRSASGKGDWR